MTTTERHAEYQRQYDEQAAKLAAQCETCRYCKTARKRLRIRLEADSYNTPEQIEKRVATARCGPHRDAGRLLYATSPVSENYWAS